MLLVDNINPTFCLIQAVQKYYPVGFNLTNQQYNGFHELNQAVRSEKEELQPNVTSFETSLRAEFPDHRIETLHPHFVPCHSFVIPLSVKDSAGLKHIVRVAIKISILVNYYTIFYINHISVFNDQAVTTVLSFEIQEAWGKDKQINTFKTLLNRHFPKHFFIPHKLLFDLKVHMGIPFDADYYSIQTIRPVYAFLFENEVGYPGLYVTP